MFPSFLSSPRTLILLSSAFLPPISLPYMSSLHLAFSPLYLITSALTFLPLLLHPFSYLSSSFASFPPPSPFSLHFLFPFSLLPHLFSSPFLPSSFFPLYFFILSGLILVFPLPLPYSFLLPSFLFSLSYFFVTLPVPPSFLLSFLYTYLLTLLLSPLPLLMPSFTSLPTPPRLTNTQEGVVWEEVATGKKKARSWLFERRMNEIIEFARPLRERTLLSLVTQYCLVGNSGKG